MWKFFKNLYRGYMRCPPLSPHVHLCLQSKRNSRIQKSKHEKRVLWFIDAQLFLNIFEGGTWGCEKNWEGVLYSHVLLNFYDPIFLSLLMGFMR
jgi:hypothetical protein